MEKRTKITTIDRLKEYASEESGADCYIALGGGMLKSSKQIYYDKGVWTICHNIDGSIKSYNTDRKFCEEEDNIMDAIVEGCFFMY